MASTRAIQVFYRKREGGVKRLNSPAQVLGHHDVRGAAALGAGRFRRAGAKIQIRGREGEPRGLIRKMPG